MHVRVCVRTHVCMMLCVCMFYVCALGLCDNNDKSIIAIIALLLR